MFQAHPPLSEWRAKRNTSPDQILLLQNVIVLAKLSQAVTSCPVPTEQTSHQFYHEILEIPIYGQFQDLIVIMFLRKQMLSSMRSGLV